MAEHPVFPLFVDQFIGDTTGLTNAEVGSYILLMLAAWRSKGQLPDDDTRLARMARVTRAKWRASMRAALEPYWEVKGGTWTNKKLTETRQKRINFVNSRSPGGRANARKTKKPDPACEDLELELEQVDSSLSVPDRESQSLTNGEDKDAGRKIKRPAKIDVKDWRPDEADHRYAEEQGRDPDRIWQDIADWCENVSRAKRLKVSPRRFWQKWCRTARDRGEAGLGAGSGKAAAGRGGRRRSDEIDDALRGFASRRDHE